MSREGAEQGRGGDRRQRPDEPGPERGGKGRKQDAVRRQVVTPIPVVVPDQEPVGREQIGAKHLRGEVGARRSRDQVGEREDDGRDHARASLWR